MLLSLFCHADHDLWREKRVSYCDHFSFLLVYSHEMIRRSKVFFNHWLPTPVFEIVPSWNWSVVANKYFQETSISIPYVTRWERRRNTSLPPQASPMSCVSLSVSTSTLVFSQGQFSPETIDVVNTSYNKIRRNSDSNRFSKTDLNHFKLNGMCKDSYDVVRCWRQRSPKTRLSIAAQHQSSSSFWSPGWTFPIEVFCVGSRSYTVGYSPGPQWTASDRDNANHFPPIFLVTKVHAVFGVILTSPWNRDKLLRHAWRFLGCWWFQWERTGRINDWPSHLIFSHQYRNVNSISRFWYADLDIVKYNLFWSIL